MEIGTRDFQLMGDMSIDTLYSSEYAHNTIATAMESFCPNQRNLDEITPLDNSSYPMNPVQTGIHSTLRFFDELVNAETDEEIEECMMGLSKMSLEASMYYEAFEDSDILIESVGAVARDVARKTRQTVRSTTRKVARTAKSIDTHVNKAIDPMEKFITASMEKIRRADAQERRNIIIRGGIIPKITRWLKRSIAIIAGVVVGGHVAPVAVITTITFLGWICTDKALDKKERTRILKELEDEIEVVNEKIDDARGDTNKQKKYELMRIRNKLKRTSDRIRFNLNSPAEEDVVVVSAGKKDKK